MDKETMIDICKKTMHYQDIGDFDSQIKLYAEDCTFLMPLLKEAMVGTAQLKKNVEGWPKATTTPQWFTTDGANRLVAGWGWRREGSDSSVPTLRGVSIFQFNDAGLIQDYEDFFDPDWMTRHDTK